MASELSEERLAHIEREWLARGWCGRDIPSWEIDALIAEVRRHRAARLTAEEVEALGWLQLLVGGVVAVLPGHERVMANAVLDKLLAHSRDGAGE